MLLFLPVIFWIVDARSSTMTMHEQTKSLGMHSKQVASRACQKYSRHAAQAIYECRHT